MINLILTSKARLLSRYGDLGLREIAARAETLRQLWAQQQPTAAAHFVYHDDGPSLKQFGLRPVANDTMSIRRLLADIEAQAGPIDHLLLLGGPLVIPWWRLDNMVNADDDPEILSDNPYGCRDDDWLVPDRKLGRLPDAEGVAGADATPLLTGLQTAINARQPLLTEARPKAIPAQASGVSTLPGCSLPFLRRTLDRPPLNQLTTPPPPQPVSYTIYARAVSRPAMDAPSFGYTAAIWQQAATLIYRTVQAVGNGQLLVCPPDTATTLDPQMLIGSRFLYFNLHGVTDRPQWFGQSKPVLGVSPTYPDALFPAQLVEIAEQIKATAPFIFSEACFGAWVEGKRTDDAICLQLLALGVSGFVGSTVTSYGRSEPPLSEADLLTELFFRRLYAGDSSGQALTRAKAEYASRMLGSFTYLDEDDRKTLLEFVLYGDPMLRAFQP